MENSISNFGGVDTYTNPFNSQDGQVLHCLNLASDTQGSRIKREGYATYLGTPDTDEVKSLFSWTRDNGTQLFTYRASGSSLYYSTQGTGDWTICGNGTISDGANVTYGVLDDQMMIGDGVGTMRYTTDGTSFSDIALAPVGGHHPVEYQGRMYALGTNSYDFYSTTGTVSDWTTDSSSLFIGGAGKMLSQFKASDRLVLTKTSQIMHRYDGEEDVDLATDLGPTSAYSIGEVEDFRFWINNLGIFTSNANKPQLVSNPIQRQIYNRNDTGIGAATFKTAVGGVHNYDYMVAVGSVRDDFTDIPINNALIMYDYKHNEFFNYQYADNPTAFHSYKDVNGVQQLIFGDSSGQCYQTSGTVTADNGAAIEASMMLMVHGNLPHIRKDFGFIEFYTSPGCSAKVQFAVDDIVTRDSVRTSGALKWRELGDLRKGYTLFNFPPESRGRIMYLRIYEAGTTQPWTLYSIHYTFTPVAL